MLSGYRSVTSLNALLIEFPLRLF
ncbi:uncharacterized protein FFMR_00545 [Fusarium fujikuroi]|nr:uncharacterized protein FFMR_00545 [Fusarium fujikuroi]